MSVLFSQRLPEITVVEQVNLFIYLFILIFFICSEFCHTLKWKGLGFTCLPHSDPPSHHPPHKWIYLFMFAASSVRELWGISEKECKKGLVSEWVIWGGPRKQGQLHEWVSEWISSIARTADGRVKRQLNSLSFPLGLCWHGWGWSHSFFYGKLVAFKKLPVLLGYPFLVIWFEG